MAVAAACLAVAASAYALVPPRDPPYDEQKTFLRRIALPSASAVALPDATDDGLPLEPPPPEIREGFLERLKPGPHPPDVIPWDTTYITISPTELRLDLAGLLLHVPADAEVGGFDVGDKYGNRTQYYVVPLGQALDWVVERWKVVRAAVGEESRMAPLVVLADRAVPQRVLNEVMYTVGQSEQTPIYAAGRKDGAIVAFRPEPSPARLVPVAHPPLDYEFGIHEHLLAPLHENAGDSADLLRALLSGDDAGAPPRATARPSRRP
jgi:hypothetical protein